MFTQLSRGFIALWGLMMTLVGSAMMVNPSIIIEKYSLEPLNAMGWSALSGNFASLLILLGIFAIMGALKNDRSMFWNIVLIEAIVMIGRIVAIFQHGYIESMLPLIIAEVVIAIVVLNHIRLLTKQAP